MSKYPLGIVVQDTSERPYKTQNIEYHGIAEYYSFTASCNCNGRFRADYKSVIDKTVKTQPPFFALYISNTDDYTSYIKICKEQDIPTRSLFVFSDIAIGQWQDKIIDGIMLGYELAYSVYDDPELLYFLDREPSCLRFREQLNKNGLFNSADTADEFRKHIYSVFPYVEEEIERSMTFIAEIWELKQ